LIEKAEIGKELLSYNISDFKSTRAKKVVKEFLNDKSRVNSDDVLLELNSLLQKLEVSNNTEQKLKDITGHDVVGTI
jgi:DNA-binding ferritin-like protein (Dps family)